MDLVKLKAFVVVAEELNFRKSAEILGMSQPPLTRLIASLEKELGTKLFERTTRSVSLTGAGILLLKEAREIASAIGRIETEVRAVGKMKSGGLKVGFSRTAFLTRFPSIIEEYQSRFPKVKIDLIEESNHEVLKLLKKGLLDLAFSESLIDDNNIKSHEISSESVGVFVPHKHPLAKNKDIHFQDLINETIILHSRREATEFYDRVSHLLESPSKKPRVYVKSPGESCQVLVAMGKGVSLTVNGSWSAIPNNLRLVQIKNMFVPIRVFWRTDNRTPQLNSFLSLAIEKNQVLSQKAECLVLSNEIFK